MSDYTAHYPAVLRRATLLRDHVRELLAQDAELPLRLTDLFELIDELLVSYPPAEYLLAKSHEVDPRTDAQRAGSDNLLIFMEPLAIDAALLRQGVSLRALASRLENIEAWTAHLTLRAII